MSGGAAKKRKTLLIEFNISLFSQSETSDGIITIGVKDCSPQYGEKGQTHSDSLELELVVEGFESGGVLAERREVSGENALEARRQVVLPPHLPQAENAVFTAQELHTQGVGTRAHVNSSSLGGQCVHWHRKKKTKQKNTEEVHRRPAYLLFFAVEGFKLQRRVLLLRQLQLGQCEAEIRHILDAHLDVLPVKSQFMDEQE